jgi:hypothetical protein
MHLNNRFEHIGLIISLQNMEYYVKTLKYILCVMNNCIYAYVNPLR